MADGEKCKKCGRVHGGSGITPDNARALYALHKSFMSAKTNHLGNANPNSIDDLIEMVLSAESAEMLALLDLVTWAHANPMQVEMLLIEVGEVMRDDAKYNSDIMDKIYNKYREDATKRG